MFLAAVGVTINHAFIDAGKGLSWLSAGFIHYVCPICGVTTIYQFFASSSDWAIKLSNPVTYVIGISVLAAIVLGPMFCGWICPFGAFQDFVAEVFGKAINEKRFNRHIPEKLDKVLRYLRYVSLATVLYMVAKSAMTLLEEINPYHALLDLFVGEFALIGLLVLGLVTVASLVIHRPWCKYLCPYGVFLGLFNILRVNSIVREPSTCVSCNLCQKACPMNIKVQEEEVTRDHQCISCLECTSDNACPRPETVSFTRPIGFQEKVKISFRNLGGSLALILLLVVTSITISNNKVDLDAYAGDESISGLSLEGSYADGTYTGTGTGFNTGLTVEITIANNQLTSIEIISHSETLGYYEVAFAQVPTDILTEQSTQVDVVSGATRSSEGIIEAVEDALELASLSQADGSDALVAVVAAEPESETVQKSYDEEESQDMDSAEDHHHESVEAAEGTEYTNLTDGVYTGSGEGYGGEMIVQVTVLDGLIEAVEVIEDKETDQFFDQAIAIIEDIIGGKTTQVDVVSGATLSSNGIINGIDDALSVEE